MGNKRILSIAAKILKAKFFKMKAPLVLSWETTQRCNSSCLYCDSPKSVHPDELSTQEALSILDQLTVSSIMRISMTGGESLIRDDIGKIISYGAEKKYLSLSLNTNGKLLEDRMDDLSGIFSFNVSLDGDNLVNDKIRGKDAYNYAIKALDCLSKKGRRFFIVSVLSKYNSNKEQILHLLDIAKYYHTKVSFQPVQNIKLFSFKNHELPLTEDRKKDIIATLLELKKNKKMSALIDNSSSCLRYFLPDSPLKKIPCYAGLLYCRMSSDGYIYSCDWNNSSTAPPDRKDMVNLRDYPFSEAFNKLTPKSCDNCSKGVVELNLAIKPKLDALIDMVRNQI